MSLKLFHMKKCVAFSIKTKFEAMCIFHTCKKKNAFVLSTLSLCEESLLCSAVTQYEQVTAEIRARR